MFKGILIDKDEAGYRVNLTDIDEAQLPAGDVTINVSHSTLNYKDALAITGQSPIVRSFPMVPGIDLAGTVQASDTPEYKVGDNVLLNGWGVGEGHWGGLAQKARLKSEWLIPFRHRYSCQAWLSGDCLHRACFGKRIFASTRRSAGRRPGDPVAAGATFGQGAMGGGNRLCR
ncbi:Oxidoreductase [Pseudomonas savastanoi pv. glycinea]|nr:Oxidoreductase [Pseudomonas savastanoi pv. glycinea]KPC31260.1 Oxidoreductase [Pseudomonas savastanoi pv. glycinea]KPC38205.1 Oxidoreductase [Pseudomonas savastanoi pv. glycinea]KPC42202.1 Oxidoreductase [Pseudomonas savastanoi pv. glycinea]